MCKTLKQLFLGGCFRKSFNDITIMTTGQSTPSPAPHSSGSSGFSDDDSLPFEERTGLTLLDFVEHLKQKGRRGLLDEYAEIVSKNPEGSFNVSRSVLNNNPGL